MKSLNSNILLRTRLNLLIMITIMRTEVLYGAAEAEGHKLQIAFIESDSG